jgi:hypothetical protein
MWDKLMAPDGRKFMFRCIQKNDKKKVFFHKKVLVFFLFDARLSTLSLVVTW